MKTITLITNSEVLSFEDTVKLSKKLSRNGLNRIQIRERNISHTSLTNFIKKMKDSVEESCELFINGNLDLAIENNLNGVHFPEKYQINEYQNKENLILGRSIHENTDLNKHQKKFDYYHLGPIFVTQSHPNQNTIKEKNISEDEVKKNEKIIQENTDVQIKKIDEKVISKEEEIMKI